MKPENENHDHSADAFERELTSFRRAAPPEAWRDELLANAIPSVNPDHSGETRRFSFSLSEKFFGGALAAAWLMIFALWTTAPSDERFAETALPAKDSVQTKSLPMLAWRFSGGEPDEFLLP